MGPSVVRLSARRIGDGEYLSQDDGGQQAMKMEMEIVVGLLTRDNLDVLLRTAAQGYLNHAMYPPPPPIKPKRVHVNKISQTTEYVVVRSPGVGVSPYITRAGNCAS